MFHCQYKHMVFVILLSYVYNLWFSSPVRDQSSSSSSPEDEEQMLEACPQACIQETVEADISFTLMSEESAARALRMWGMPEDRTKDDVVFMELFFKTLEAEVGRRNRLILCFDLKSFRSPSLIRSPSWTFWVRLEEPSDFFSVAVSFPCSSLCSSQLSSVCPCSVCWWELHCELIRRNE